MLTPSLALLLSLAAALPTGVGEGPMLLSLLAALVIVLFGAASFWLAVEQDRIDSDRARWLAEREADEAYEREQLAWRDGIEAFEDLDLERASREWQQQVERPLSRDGMARFGRDFSKPVELTDEEAERVYRVIFPERKGRRVVQ